MVLQSINWKIESDKSALMGFSGENNTEDLYVIPQVMEDYTYTMECRAFDMSAFIPLEKVEYSGRAALHALLTAEQIGPAGKVEMQLVGRRTDSNGILFKKKSNVFNVYVGDSINATQQFKDMPASAFEQYVTKAGESADKAKASEEASKTSEDNAKLSEKASAASESNAKASERAAAQSEQKAGEHEEAARQYASNAEASADAASLSEQNATKSEAAAQSSEEEASKSASAAAGSAESAALSASSAEGHDDSAKQYADQAKASAEASKASADAADDSEAAALQSEKKAEDYAERAKQSANTSGWIRTYYDPDDNLMMEKSDGISASATDLRYDEDDNLEVVFN